MRRLGLVAVAAWAALLGSAARAEPVYAYQFDQLTYTVTAGGTVDVRVFLRETLGPGDTSLLATEGLFSAGVRVTFDTPPVPSDRARVLDLADIAGNPAFNDPFGPTKSLVPLTSAGLAENVSLVSPAGVLATGGPTTYEVFLGTFRFTGGSVVGQTTQLRAIDFSLLDETVTFRTGTVLDGRIAAGQATITVVLPEPAGLGLLGTGALGLLAYAVCRSQRSRPRSPSAITQLWFHANSRRSAGASRFSQKPAVRTSQ